MRAETIRVATFNVELFGRGPGLMLRDILHGDARATAVARIIAHVAPDILLLQGVDYDAELHGAGALRDLIGNAGLSFPHVFALRPNSGMATEFDLDGDGQRGTARDAQGFGYFAGQRGMAVMSRWPVLQDQVQDFSTVLWQNLPGATLPVTDGRPFPSEAAQSAQRLSSTGHWIVPIAPPDAPPLNLMAFSATPPVFDGPEDRNGLRNADEILLWVRVLEGNLGTPPPDRFFILGAANLDPEQGEGLKDAIRTLLNHPGVQDPQPFSKAGGMATVDWTDPVPGDLRVDYVLPSSDWKVAATGVFWPDPNSPDHELLSAGDVPASRHRLVWVDVVASGTGAP